MNRAERRAQARHGTWKDLPRQLRQLSELDKVLSIQERAKLRRAADRLDNGDRPLIVMASISTVLAKVDRVSRGR